MDEIESSGRQWAREAQDALADARQRSLPAAAWRALQVLDAEGHPAGSVPYSAASIECFARAHERDRDDIGIIHHLAIAHHSRAWDLELIGDPAAAVEWQQALDYWRVIAFSKEFWQAMEDKLRACDATADPQPVRDTQRNLLEDLLGVHVEFIRHYCETGRAELALAHVSIIQRAQIPPALKKRLESRVLEAMTAAVPDAKAAGEYESAMLAAERFLSLFPANLAAIRMLAEIALALLSRFSWEHDWDAIQKLHERVRDTMTRGASIPEMATDALTRTAIEELAVAFSMRGSDRGWPVFRDSDDGPATQRDDGLAAFELAIHWGRLAVRWASTGSPLRDLLAGSILGHAGLLRQEAAETYRCDFDHERCLDSALDLYRKLTVELQEAMEMQSVDPKLIEYLQSMLSNAQDELQSLESEKRSSYFRGGRA